MTDLEARDDVMLGRKPKTRFESNAASACWLGGERERRNPGLIKENRGVAGFERKDLLDLFGELPGLVQVLCG